MITEMEFRDRSTEALEDLEEKLFLLADQHDFEVDSGTGILTLTFEEPAPTKFIISPNAPARQIWVSALVASYKFDWDESKNDFVLDKTRESLTEVMGQLIGKHLGVSIRLS